MYDAELKKADSTADELLELVLELVHIVNSELSLPHFDFYAQS